MPPKRAAKKPEDQDADNSREPSKYVTKKHEAQEPEKSSEASTDIANPRSLRTRKPVVYKESQLGKDRGTNEKSKGEDVKPARKAPKKKGREGTEAGDGAVNKTETTRNMEEMGMDETFVVGKVAKKGRAAKAGTSKENGDLAGENEEPTTKKIKGTGVKLNKTETDYSIIDFTSNTTTGDNRAWNFKIASWNIDGLRGWIKKDGPEYIEHEDPDIICLQELKCPEDKIPSEMRLKGYHQFWNCAVKDGYSGVGLLSKSLPVDVQYSIGIEELDNEGRFICAEYEKFYLVNVYVPNAGRSLVTLPKRLEWDNAFSEYLCRLDSKKPVIVCGDMNVSHKEIDLANPKSNAKNAGFTREERQGMTDLLAKGFIDSFRLLYPEEVGAYTFWTYLRNAREKNVGWRLDYYLISERFVQNVCDNIIRKEVYGSDHCPIVLLLSL